MRGWLLLAAMTLGACGQSQTPAADAPAAQAGGGMDLSGHLVVLGPDWRLDSIPDQNATVLVFPEQDLTISGPYVLPEATSTGAQAQAGDISLTLTPGACAIDGATYPMQARVSFTNSSPQDGCAFITWDRHLLELMPQIDACIAQSPDTRWVTYAGDRGSGETVVRIEGDGVQKHCSIRDGVATITPRVEANRIGGENAAIFVRSGGNITDNPGGECFEAPEVRSEGGELLGWMMDPEGC